MRKATLATILLVGAMLGMANLSRAQFTRYDQVWARTTDGAALTLDGKLDEPAWALAESVVVRYKVDNGIPGSGWKDEGGFPGSDRTRAVFKFLTVGNQLWIGAIVPDSSIGGTKDFNYFDGLLMSIKQHQLGQFPAPPGEHFISWWWPETTYVNPLAVDNPMSMRGVFRPDPTVPPTPLQQQEWDAVWKVHGHVNSDAQPDTNYTIEMRFDLGMNGYDVTKVAGDAVEWNVSVYDTDWDWPLTYFIRLAVNRSWIEGPWGNAAWYSDVKILSRPDVTIHSGSLPAKAPDMIIPSAGNYASPVIDGQLTDPVWAVAPHFDIRWDDAALRASYPGTGPWRSGQYQPDVNGTGNKAFVDDGADCTIKYFYKADTLFLGFDFRDKVVQYHSLFDRWDGAIVTLTDRTRRFLDNNLFTHRLSFQVGPTGALLPRDELTYFRDTTHTIRAQLHLNPGTTVDTLGVNVDNGYTAEMAIDLTAMGYAADLGDRALYFGIDILDGDSYSPITDSYGTRTWFFRETEGSDGPCVAFLDPGTFVAGTPPETPPAKLALLGNFPNPFLHSTTIRYALPEDALVRVEVFDLLGRQVATQAMGLQSAGQREARLSRFEWPAGV